MTESQNFRMLSTAAPKSTSLSAKSSHGTKTLTRTSDSPGIIPCGAHKSGSVPHSKFGANLIVRRTRLQALSIIHFGAEESACGFSVTCTVWLSESNIQHDTSAKSPYSTRG